MFVWLGSLPKALQLTMLPHLFNEFYLEGNDLRYKHIYLCYVDNYIGAFNPDSGEIRYATSEKFVPFVEKILKDFPDYTPHNVINYGIEESIRKKIKSDYIKSKGLIDSNSER